MPERDTRLPVALSLYLDLVRLGAAIVVVLSHAWPILFPRHPLAWPGHDAVVVFFVLSGFLIAHAASRPKLTALQYANLRLARVWSVAIPALALSICVALLVGGRGLSNAGPGVSKWPNAILNVALNLFGLGQNWWIVRSPPLNAPFWSLNFEIWYYVIFGASQFLRGRWRAITIAALMLIAGPKILVLFPVWLMGVLLYYNRRQWTETKALIVWVLTVTLAISLIRSGLSVTIRETIDQYWPALVANLHGANQFVGDWLLAIVVAANFAAAASLGRLARPLLAYPRPIRVAASYTFSSYLYHVPLLAFAIYFLHLKSWAAMLMVVGGIIVLGQVSERQLPKVQRALHHLLTGPIAAWAEQGHLPRGKAATTGISGHKAPDSFR